MRLPDIIHGLNDPHVSFTAPQLSLKSQKPLDRTPNLNRRKPGMESVGGVITGRDEGATDAPSLFPRKKLPILAVLVKMINQF